MLSGELVASCSACRWPRNVLHTSPQIDDIQRYILVCVYIYIYIYTCCATAAVMICLRFVLFGLRKIFDFQ